MKEGEPTQPGRVKKGERGEEMGKRECEMENGQWKMENEAILTNTPIYQKGCK